MHVKWYGKEQMTQIKSILSSVEVIIGSPSDRPQSIIQDGIEFTYVNGTDSWVRIDVPFQKQFEYKQCRWCKKLISNCGWASKKHYDMHKRKGDLTSGQLY